MPKQQNRLNRGVATITLLLTLSGGFPLEARQLDKAAEDLVKKKIEALDKWWIEHTHAGPEMVKEPEPKPGIRDPSTDPKKAVEVRAKDDLDDVQLARNPKEDSKITKAITKCGREVLVKDPLKRAVKAGWEAAIVAYKQPGATSQMAIAAACDGFNQRVKEEADSIEQHPDEKLMDVLKCVLKDAVVEPVKQALNACVTSIVHGQSYRDDCLRSHLMY
jgi:hypothetical protein